MLLAGGLVNMSTRAMRLKTQVRALACLQVVYPALPVVKEQSLSASLVRLEKELFPLYLGHPLCGRIPLAKRAAQAVATGVPSAGGYVVPVRQRRRLAPPPTPCLARNVANVIISKPAPGARAILHHGTDTSTPSGTEYFSTGFPSTRFHETRISPCGVWCVAEKESTHSI